MSVQMISDRESGLTWRQIAKKHGVSHETVRSKVLGVAPHLRRIPPPLLSAEEVALVVAHGLRKGARELGTGAKVLDRRFRATVGRGVEEEREVRRSAVDHVAWQAWQIGATWRAVWALYRRLDPVRGGAWRKESAAQEAVRRYADGRCLPLRKARIAQAEGRYERVVGMRARGWSWADVAEAEGYKNAGSAAASHRVARRLREAA